MQYIYIISPYTLLYLSLLKYTVEINFSTFREYYLNFALIKGLFLFNYFSMQTIQYSVVLPEIYILYYHTTIAFYCFYHNQHFDKGLSVPFMCLRGTGSLKCLKKEREKIVVSKQNSIQASAERQLTYIGPKLQL